MDANVKRLISLQLNFLLFYPVFNNSETVKVISKDRWSLTTGFISKIYINHLAVASLKFVAKLFLQSVRRHANFLTPIKIPSLC